MKIDKFIGIPFVNKGRNYNGCDCYGLVKLYYKDILGIDIPDVIANPKQIKLAYIEYLDNVSKYWKEHNTPIEGSVVAMLTDINNPNLVTHFGVIVKVDNKLKILHTFKHSQSHLIDINNLAYRNKIKAFYTWQP